MDLCNMTITLFELTFCFEKWVSKWDHVSVFTYDNDNGGTQRTLTKSDFISQNKKFINKSNQKSETKH